jgi:hypothetical protein
MLQGRLVSYQDTHLYRIGVNYRDLKVNRPRVPVRNYMRDGQFAGILDEGTGHPNYWPNSVPGAPQPDPSYAEPPWHLGDVTVPIGGRPRGPRRLHTGRRPLPPDVRRREGPAGARTSPRPRRAPGRRSSSASSATSTRPTRTTAAGSVVDAQGNAPGAVARAHGHADIADRIEGR